MNNYPQFDYNFNANNNNSNIPIRYYYTTSFLFLPETVNNNYNLDIQYNNTQNTQNTLNTSTITFLEIFNQSSNESTSESSNLYDIYFPSVNLIQGLFDDYLRNKNKLNDDEYNDCIKIKDEKINECPVCFNSHDKTVTLKKCNHSFCEDCIKNWLKNHKNTCPICRDIVNNSNDK